MQVAFETTVKIEQREKRAQEMMQPAVHTEYQVVTNGNISSLLIYKNQ